MAKIGLNNFRYSKLTEAEDGTPTYDGGKKPAKAIDCKVAVENNNAELYADDGLAENDKSFKKATVTIIIDEDNDEMMADILGHTITEDTSEMIRKDTDMAPYIGFGRIISKMVDGVLKHKVEFLPKVKFAEPSQEDTTQGENVEFKTTTLEGTAMKLADGTWSRTKTFTDKAEAITFLDSLLAKKA